MKKKSQEKYAERFNALPKRGNLTISEKVLLKESSTKMRPVTIEPKELLKVMTPREFNYLFTRGEFDIIQSYRHCGILLESVPTRFILDLAERQGCSNEKSQLSFLAVPFGSADLKRKDYTRFQPIAVVYRRVERQSLYRRNHHQVGVLLSVDEYERFCKTPLGRFYISSFQWEKCSLQVARV